jgi:hypothetical protein
MPATMTREAWTDDRMDDLSKRVDEGFREVRTEIRDLRKETREGEGRLRGEMKSEFARVDGRLDALQRTMLQVGGGLGGAMLVGFIGLIATQL